MFKHLPHTQRILMEMPSSQLTFNLGSDIGVEEFTEWVQKAFVMQKDRDTGSLLI
jgi:hypothetical protein